MIENSLFKSKILKLSQLEMAAKSKRSFVDRLLWIGATPPPFKLLWKCGLNVRPVLFWTSIEMMLFFSIPFGILIELFGGLKVADHSAPDFFVISDPYWHILVFLSSFIFGLFLSMMAKRTRKKMG